MAPPTLVSMAQRACIRNILGVQDVGEMPYALVRPILKKIDNPDQLKEIEDASPHIADHDAELWKAFIARDISNWKDKIMEPKNPRSWWKVYRKLLREEQRAKEAGEEQLKAALTAVEKKKEENQMHYVPKVLAEPMRQTAFVDGKPNPNVRCLGETVMVKKPTLKNAKTGFQMVSAIRRETAKNIRERRQNRVSVPPIRCQIKSAPRSMLSQYTNPAPPMKTESPTSPRSKVFVSRPAPTNRDRAIEARDRVIDSTLRAEQVKREERLKALASASSKSAAQSPPPASPTAATNKPTTHTLTKNTSTTAVPPLKPPTAHAATTNAPMKKTSAPPRTEDKDSPAKLTTPPPVHEPVAAPKAVADLRSTMSPSPAPPLIRKRPATPVSVFMPAKKKRVA